MDSKKLTLRPISTKRDGSFDGKVASRERSSLANASFRVYYSLRAGAVPFLWESTPGTPKSGATAPASPAPPAKTVAPVSSAVGSVADATLPPISPPPSYQSSQLKGRRCRPRSSWPTAPGGIVRALLGMLGLRKRHCRSQRQRPTSYL